MSRRLPILLAVILPWLVVDAVSACSTCFGDPESKMVKGALMGVYVMIGVVGFVLAGFTGTTLFWIRRSRRIAPTDRHGETS